MSHAAAWHRDLDRRFNDALARDGGDQAHGHALVVSRNRLKDARSMNAPRKPRVLLLEVEIRTSERTGKAWYAGWLGKARLVGFEADDANARGHRVIQFYAEEHEPRDGMPAPRQRATGREAASAGTGGAPATGARPCSAAQAAHPDAAQPNSARLARAAQE